MKIWLGAYHGSRREIAALKNAGYEIPPGKMIMSETIDGNPFEIAEKIHTAGNHELKVAVGNYAKDEVIIWVSDDWFHQR